MKENKIFWNRLGPGKGLISNNAHIVQKFSLNVLNGRNHKGRVPAKPVLEEQQQCILMILFIG